MKIIVSGATGLVGSEIIRQCLDIDAVTEVIALARSPIQIDRSNKSSKIKSVIIEDYEYYPDHVKAAFAGADACIWCVSRQSLLRTFSDGRLITHGRTVAITPFRSGSFSFEEVKRVCQSCTLTGLQTIYEAQGGRPFRFMYLSAEGTPDDPTKKPMFMGDYQIMRVSKQEPRCIAYSWIISIFVRMLCSHCKTQRETELQLQEFSDSNANIEICIARPGVVTNSTTWGRAALASLLQLTNHFSRAIPNVGRSELAAAILSQILHGFSGEMLSNVDLVGIGQEALRAKES